MFKFIKSRNLVDTYIVCDEENFIGHIQKIRDWTVRGNRVRWEPRRMGRLLRSESTREAAAKALKTVYYEKV